MKKIICTSLALLMLTGCAANVAKNDLNRETIYQVSLLQGLTDGDFEGSVTIGELKKHGDTGIGTFNGLNGELVLVDGTVYQNHSAICVVEAKCVYNHKVGDH